MIKELVKDVQEMKLCGPSDDPDEITAVSSAYYYLLTQLQTHAARILSIEPANELRVLNVEINDIYSVYEAKAKLDALIPDILDALEEDEEKESPAVTKWYLEIRKSLRDIQAKAMDTLELLEEGDKDAAKPIGEYLKKDYKRLQELWNEKIQGDPPTYLGRHIYWGMANDYRDLLRRDLPEFEEQLDKNFLQMTQNGRDLGFEGMLHTSIAKSCYKQYCDGHLRDAVLNSIVSIFDLIRSRTGIDADGTNLVNKAFSLSDPYLVLSELATESGQNDQKGFIQIFNGSYQGIRNPKAHTLNHDLTEAKAAQYLVFASLLARRIEEATLVEKRS